MTLQNHTDFSSISESALQILRAELSKPAGSDPLVRLYARFGYLARTTSDSIRTLIETSNIVPAIALARVRLEQVIVSSYLIHEAPHVARVPYLMHHPIDAYRNHKGAIEHPELAKHLSQTALQATRTVAMAAKGLLDPAFDGTDAKLNRSKWTNLDLLSMAKRRDALTKDLKGPSPFPLEMSYLSFYRDFSSVTHTTSMSISPEFVSLSVAEDGSLRFEPVAIWGQYLAMTLSSWDILHVYELLKAVARSRDADLKALNQRWTSLRDDFFQRKDSAELCAAPNGGPATPLSNSGVTEGPPSVS
jgi:hypothetical protein